jgi:hypothetical protein
MRVIWRMGVKAPYRAAFWRFLGNILRTNPRLLARGIAQSVNGEHVIRFTRDDVIPRLVATEQESPRATEVPGATDEIDIPRQVALAMFSKSSETSRLAQLRRTAHTQSLKM